VNITTTTTKLVREQTCADTRWIRKTFKKNPEEHPANPFITQGVNTIHIVPDPFFVLSKLPS
jgi:hypothetical protein